MSKAHFKFNEHEREQRKFEDFVTTELKSHSRLLQEIRSLLLTQDNKVVGGTLYQGVFPMIPIAPGNSPQFAVAPLPLGVKTLAAQVTVTSADPLDVITLNASDPTGLTFTDLINPNAAVPVTLNLTWTYTNLDGTVVNVTGVFSEVIDVTGGTMSQVA
jgi:hypothetical protein